MTIHLFDEHGRLIALAYRDVPAPKSPAPVIVFDRQGRQVGYFYRELDKRI